MRPTSVLFLLSILLVPLLDRPAQAQIPRLEVAKADLVVVYKSKRVLQLKREGRVIKGFRIALGRDPKGPKRMEGDGRTPEGVYVLDWRNPRSEFYRSIHISYPHPRDTEHARRWGVDPGGLIMLHGLPNGMRASHIDHPRTDWTNGCIAVSDEEMDEIWARVDDGTTIIIYP